MKRRYIKKNRYPISIDTFKDVDGYWIDQLIKREPSCFNGMVDVIKYRITVEKINESTDVYSERLNKIWGECDNWHHWEPLKDKAAELGVTLIGHAGHLLKKS